MTQHKKLVLAYSGGLDTSIILKWFIEEGYEVIAYIADIGQEEDFKAAEQKALALGASKVCIENLQEEFVRDYIYPCFAANAVYESRYLLGTAIARPLIAKKQIEIARRENAAYVAHGATGKGNDQVRFELAYYALNPDIIVLAPWKMPSFLEKFKGRRDMTDYARLHGIPVKEVQGISYSEDENLLHISHEAGLLEEPDFSADETVYSRTCAPENAPDAADTISLSFQDGIPSALREEASGAETHGALALFKRLNALGAKHGIGRLDMVENRYVGLKSRGIYETPGGAILHSAHLDLEGLSMDREVKKLRDALSGKFAECVYNGYWFSPEMDILRRFMQDCQKNISGAVRLKLYKGAVYPLARSSAASLYDADLSSFDGTGGYNPADAEGFIKINALRLKTHYKARGQGGSHGG